MKKIYMIVAALFMVTNLSAHGIGGDKIAADAEARESLVLYQSKNNKFKLTAGGHIDMRVAYDFDGISHDLDFIPTAITGEGNQELRMDATTSYFWFNGEFDAGKLGPVKMVVDFDFRNGKTMSYTPRLRFLYMTFKGLTLGRNVTTFCDLGAAPMTIDFQQPNSYTFHFATMIRYNLYLLDKKLDLCVAAELPSVPDSGVKSHTTIEQRVPDFPFYVQYNFGKEYKSHIRVLGLLRDIYYKNNITKNNTSLLGWGAGLSGHLQFCKPFELFFNGQYGQGITTYMMDMNMPDQNVNVVTDPENPNRIETRKMWGWQIGAHFNLLDNLYLSTGYSVAGIDNNKQYSAENSKFGGNYRKGQYAFGGAFWQFSKHCQFAMEYLYGTRENMDGVKNHANRIQARVRVSF